MSQFEATRLLSNSIQLNDCGMGWFQVDFSRKLHMSRPRNSYSKEFSQITIEICFKKCAIPTDFDFGVLSKKLMFLYFSGPNINHRTTVKVVLQRHGVHNFDSFAQPSYIIYDSCI